jgi:hypothetical protein
VHPQGPRPRAASDSCNTRHDNEGRHAKHPPLYVCEHPLHLRAATVAKDLREPLTGKGAGMHTVTYVYVYNPSAGLAGRYLQRTGLEHLEARRGGHGASVRHSQEALPRFFFRIDGGLYPFSLKLFEGKRSRENNPNPPCPPPFGGSDRIHYSLSGESLPTVLPF